MHPYDNNEEGSTHDSVQGTNMTSVEIAVPTYNASAYLDQLFNSIVKQDFEDWRIIARDDASTDDSLEQLRKWQAILGNRMILVEDGFGNLGMVGNYDALLRACSAPRVMLADPDDVWLPGKMRTTLAALQNAEAELGPDFPVAVCTDATVVNHSLALISPSHWQWSKMRPDRQDEIRHVAMECVALTSTMVLNRALLDLALPMQGAATCPDWWPALVAVTFGRLIRLPEATILYRRHPANDSVAPYSSSLKMMLTNLVRAPSEPRRRLARLLRQMCPQALAIAERFSQRMARQDVAAMSALASLPQMGMVQRRLAIVRHGLWFGSPLKNLALLVLV